MMETKLQQREPDYTFINNIITLREGKYTQEQMAALLHIKRPRYAAWEEKRSAPAYFYKKKLAQLFGYTVDQLSEIPIAA